MTSQTINSGIMIGNTGVAIPSLCFGTSGLGDMPVTYGYNTTEAQAHDTLRHIFEGPCPFIDSSRNYGDGRSEQRIGQVIRKLGGVPEGVVISTKLDRDMETGRFDSARARESLEQSLSIMNIDHVDILHLHDPEHAASVAEISGKTGALPELIRMKEEGLCKAIGLAAGRVDIMIPLLHEWPFDCLISHNRYTLVNRNANEMFNLATSLGITVMNAAPYAGGVFAKGSLAHPRYVYQQASETMLAPVRQIEAICKQHNVSTGAVALQFSMRDQRIASTICGVSRPQRVAQTLQWATEDIPEALWSDLADLQVSHDDPEATREYHPG